MPGLANSRYLLVASEASGRGGSGTLAAPPTSTLPAPRASHTRLASNSFYSSPFTAHPPLPPSPRSLQLVHEVDAMGGEIGRMADRCYLQKRVLNRSKVRALL